MERDPDIEFGTVFEDSRTDDLLQLTYLDSERYMLRDEHGKTRYGIRNEFDKYISTGRYTVQPDADSIAETGVLGRVLTLMSEYESSEGRKSEHKAEAIQEALNVLMDIGSERAAEEVPFEELDGIGSKAATNLRNEGFRTCNDVRNASDDEILDVAWVGETGLDEIRDWCR
jgi:predicted flap endonuclease-1-like 5' DNA nuclease